MIIFPFLAGQVHRARLNDQEVVIKVQRPGLKDLFDIDLKNLRVGCCCVYIHTIYHDFITIVVY
jgi:hypothetical protein